MSDSIRIKSAALDEEDGDIILRGRIDPEHLPRLKVDTYQRERVKQAKIDTMVHAMEAGETLPDIELSMRGHRTREEKDGSFVLLDPTYITDGYQRTTAALLLKEKGGSPRLGATVHFGKDEAWERERFTRLNLGQTRLSANILIRNARETSKAIQALCALSEDATFPLARRVGWSQNRIRGQLLSAMTFARVAASLHAGIYGTRHALVQPLIEALNVVSSMIGRTFVENVRIFWHAIDSCFGVRTITYVQGAPQIKQTFLLVMARLLAEHAEFWREHTLTFGPDILHKIKTFPMDDPQVVRLAGSGGKAADLLYDLLVEHVNKGRRSGRLHRRVLPGKSIAMKRRAAAQGLFGAAKAKHEAKKARA